VQCLDILLFRRLYRDKAHRCSHSCSPARKL
jgi:hypothetical protein